MASSNESAMDARGTQTSRRVRRAMDDLDSGDYGGFTTELVEHWAATGESPELDESHGSRPSWSL
jgi:hypothetical protein